MSIFGDRLKQLRKGRRMTQDALAAAMHSSKQVISRYESGARTPSVEIGNRFAEFFGVTLDYLIGATDAPRAAPREVPFIPGVHRGVRQESPDPALSGVKNLVRVQKQRVPFLGEIAAGTPIFADEQREMYVTADDDIRCDFALRVKGDSMVGANIREGDIVFIRLQSDVLDGQIAAVSIDDEATLKRVYHDREGITLVAENPKYAPMLFREADALNVRILGLAVALQHRLA